MLSLCNVYTWNISIKTHKLVIVLPSRMGNGWLGEILKGKFNLH